MWTFLQRSDVGIGLILLLFSRSLCCNIRWQFTTRCWYISHVGLQFKLDWESHWAKRNIQQPWPITRKNCCLCILLWLPFECSWSRRNWWDENRWFALRVPSCRIADRMLDFIATWHCSKSYSSGESQWNFLSFESRFVVWCKSNSALPCLCRKSNDQRSREYCSRQQLWTTWQFETTEWCNLDHRSPVWLYNIDLQIQANRSTNHSIAFPMNCPMECLKKSYHV